MDDGIPRFSSLVSSTMVQTLDGSGGADFGSGEGAGGGEGNGGGEAEGDESSSSLPVRSNDDFRSALLPFLAAKPAVAESAKPKSKKGKAGKKRGRGEDSDSEVEAPDFTGPAAETADGGLILRKTKTKAGGGSHKKAGKSGPKIVF